MHDISTPTFPPTVSGADNLPPEASGADKDAFTEEWRDRQISDALNSLKVAAADDLDGLLALMKKKAACFDEVDAK